MKVVRRLQLLLSAIVLVLGASSARAQIAPNDGDPEIKPSLVDGDAKDSGVDRDDPSERLRAERGVAAMEEALWWLSQYIRTGQTSQRSSGCL